jgi:hypothetical protein
VQRRGRARLTADGEHFFKEAAAASSCMEWARNLMGLYIDYRSQHWRNLHRRYLSGPSRGIGHFVMSGIRSSSNENPVLKHAIELCAHHQ